MSQNLFGMSPYFQHNHYNHHLYETLVKDDLLYHYTSLATFLKIKSSGVLRANPFSNMNDPSESELTGRVSVPSINFENPIESKEAHQQMERLRNQLDLVRRAALVTCFSVDATENSGFIRKGFAIPQMWAHYGDNHKGVCLVFSKNRLMKLAREIDASCSAQCVTYDTSAVSGSTVSLNWKIAKPLTEEVINTACQTAAAQYLWFKKDSGWSYEQEFRIVFPKQDLPLLEIPFQDALIGLLKGSKFPSTGHQHLKDIHEKLKQDVHAIAPMYWDRGVGVAQIPMRTS